MIEPAFRRAAAFAIALVMLAAPAGAPAQPTPAQVEKAKQHYEAAERHYNVGEFEDAIREYRAAYDLTQSPALLFNIAQAYRLAGDPKQALHFYKTYLRLTARVPNIDYVQEQIAAMEAEVAERERREEERLRLEREQAAAARAEQERRTAEERRAAEEARVAAEAAAATRETEDDSDGSAGLRLAGYITGGAGVALLAAGTGFALKARSGWNDINDLADDGGAWTAAEQDAYDTAETDETLATVFTAIGAVATVTGGVLWFFGRDRGGDRDLGAALVPNAGGGALVVTGRF